MGNSIIHIMNDLKRGGATKACFRTISYLNLRTKVIILNSKETDKDIKINQKNIELYSLDWSSIQRLKKSFLIILKELKKDNNSIINCWLYKSILFGLLISILSGNKKLIWHIRHADVSFDFKDYKKFLLIRLLSILSNTRLKKIYLIYNSVKAKKTHCKIGFIKRNNYIINNGFDINKFQYKEELKQRFFKKFRFKEDIFLISMYARYHPIKNHLIFFQAMERILDKNPNVHIFLAGRFINNKNKNLKKLIKKYNLSNNITLGGLLNEKDLIGSYSATDLTILTSTSESFPNVIGESMACTTPCLTFNVGDCSQIIGSYGWILKNNNLYDLIAGIEDAIKFKEFKEKWKNLKEESRKNIYNNFSEDIEKIKYLKAFDEIFNN